MYDEGILCDDCELLFQDVDDYGTKVLLKEFETRFERKEPAPGLAFYASTAIDPDKLLRFLVSVLWRASVSTAEFYERVDLGELEAPAMPVITSHRPVPSQFAALLYYWKATPATEALVASILAPFPETFGGSECIRLYLGRVVAVVKVGLAPFNGALQQFQLGAHANVVLPEREFASSPQLDTILGAIKSSNAARESKNRSKLQRHTASRSRPTR